MKKFILLVSLFLFFIDVFAWGQKGHDTVAYIAEQHLTPAAKDSVNRLLDGYSLVYWANWLDNASHTPEYAYTKTWHYKNIDENILFENAPDIEEGNIIQAIRDQIAVLNNVESPNSDKALALKMLVHFVGDIHQPLHMGHSTDRGGNSHNVFFFDNETNLHSLWDTSLLEAGHRWSHTEWQKEIDRLDTVREEALVAGGTPESWGKETFEVCTEIYNTTSPGSSVGYDYIAKWTPTIENQLLKGGLRLADLLNSIFDADYTPLNSVIER